jgi:hypothetical protein
LGIGALELVNCHIAAAQRHRQFTTSPDSPLHEPPH